MRKKLRKWHWWSTVAALIVGGVPLLTFMRINTDVCPQAVVTQLSWLTAIGVLLTGAGNALRAAAHNANRNIDGSGKLVALVGWCISLTSVMSFTAERGDFLDDGWFVVTVILSSLFAGAVLLIGSVHYSLKRCFPKGEQDEGPVVATVFIEGHGSETVVCGENGIAGNPLLHKSEEGSAKNER